MNLSAASQGSLKHTRFQHRSDCIAVSQNMTTNHLGKQVDGISVRAKGHKPINEGSIKVHIWVLGAVEELGGMIDGIQFAILAKKFEGHKRVL